MTALLEYQYNSLHIIGFHIVSFPQNILVYKTTSPFVYEIFGLFFFVDLHSQIGSHVRLTLKSA